MKTIFCKSGSLATADSTEITGLKKLTYHTREAQIDISLGKRVNYRITLPEEPHLTVIGSKNARIVGYPV